MKEVFVHYDRCLGCLSCQMACAVEHSAGGSLFAAIAETPQPRFRLFVSATAGHKFPLTCRHCEPAPCVAGCIAGALTRDRRGAVVQLEDRCTGCWTCLMLCPYGVVARKSELKVAVKCDLCPERDEPACVAACPTKALEYCEAEAFSGQRRATAAGLVTKAMDPESP